MNYRCPERYFQLDRFARWVDPDLCPPLSPLPFRFYSSLDFVFRVSHLIPSYANTYAPPPRHAVIFSYFRFLIVLPERTSSLHLRIPHVP